MMPPLIFHPGRLVMTPGVEETFSPLEILEAIGRHARGDWGEMPRCEGSKQQPDTGCTDTEDGMCDWHKNNEAVQSDERLMSKYTLRGKVMWVITEWDRSVTTALLPDEY